MSTDDDYQAAQAWAATLRAGDIVKRAPGGQDWTVVSTSNNGILLQRPPQSYNGRRQYKALYQEAGYRRGELIQAHRATATGADQS